MRDNILMAAAQVVGELGYLDASIAKITEIAGVAHGTFYLYFESRQDLFDQLLPHVGGAMLSYIGKKIHGSKSYFEVEERGVRACFQFLDDNPGFYRLMNEAEFMAPKAHHAHFENIANHYCHSLRESIVSGEITSFDDTELTDLAYAMTGARTYIYLNYLNCGRANGSFENAIKTYLKIIVRGIK